MAFESKKKASDRPTKKYRLLCGTHHHNGVTYHPGEIIDHDEDLVDQFNSNAGPGAAKFERVEDLPSGPPPSQRQDTAQAQADYDAKVAKARTPTGFQPSPGAQPTPAVPAGMTDSPMRQAALGGDPFAQQYLDQQTDIKEKIAGVGPLSAERERQKQGAETNPVGTAPRPQQQTGTPPDHPVEEPLSPNAPGMMAKTEGTAEATEARGQGSPSHVSEQHPAFAHTDKPGAEGAHQPVEEAKARKDKDKGHKR